MPLKLADGYKDGTGVEKKYTKMIEWNKKAGELGNSCALLILGDCYQNRTGVEHNYTKAFENSK